MINFEFVGEESRDELINLLSRCFTNDSDINEAFIDYGLKKNCLALKKDGIIVAALYLINADMVYENELIPIYYAYAAGTHPDFRRKGFMSLLLKCIEDFARDNDRKYIVLVPSNDQNRRYYKKRGYLDFFKVRVVEIMNDKEIQSTVQFCNNPPISGQKMAQIQRDFLKNNGDVIWDDDHVEFAREFAIVCGTEFVFTESGYARCRLRDDELIVTDVFVPDDEIEKLMEILFNRYKFSKCVFKLPVESKLFSVIGTIENFAMIRSVCGVKNLKNCSYPYLGLPLD